MEIDRGNAEIDQGNAEIGQGNVENHQGNTKNLRGSLGIGIITTNSRIIFFRNPFVNSWFIFYINTSTHHCIITLD